MAGMVQLLRDESNRTEQNTWPLKGDGRSSESTAALEEEEIALLLKERHCHAYKSTNRPSQGFPDNSVCSFSEIPLARSILASSLESSD